MIPLLLLVIFIIHDGQCEPHLPAGAVEAYLKVLHSLERHQENDPIKSKLQGSPPQPQSSLIPQNGKIVSPTGELSNQMHFQMLEQRAQALQQEQMLAQQKQKQKVTIQQTGPFSSSLMSAGAALTSIMGGASSKNECPRGGRYMLECSGHGLCIKPGMKNPMKAMDSVSQQNPRQDAYCQCLYLQDEFDNPILAYFGKACEEDNEDITHRFNIDCYRIPPTYLQLCQNTEKEGYRLPSSNEYLCLSTCKTLQNLPCAEVYWKRTMRDCIDPSVCENFMSQFCTRESMGLPQ
eukprot:g1590.t1